MSTSTPHRLDPISAAEGATGCGRIEHPHPRRGGAVIVVEIMRVVRPHATRLDAQFGIRPTWRVSGRCQCGGCYVGAAPTRHSEPRMDVIRSSARAAWRVAEQFRRRMLREHDA